MHRLQFVLSLSLGLLLSRTAFAQEHSEPERASSRLSRSAADEAPGASERTVRPEGRIAQPESLQRAIRQRAKAGIKGDSPSNRSAIAAGISATLKALDAQAPYDVSTSGRYLVASQAKSGLVLFDTSSHRALRQLEKGARGYVLVEISGDARWIAGVWLADPNQIDLWRADNGRLIRTIQAEGGEKRSLEFSASGEELRVLPASGHGVVYRIPSGVSIGGFQTANGGSAVAPRKVEVGPGTITRTTPSPSPSAASPGTSHFGRLSDGPEASSSAPSPIVPPSTPKIAKSAPALTTPQTAPMAAAPPVAAPMAASPYDDFAPAEPTVTAPAPQASPMMAPRAMLRSELPSEPAAAAPKTGEAMSPSSTAPEAFSPGESAPEASAIVGVEPPEAMPFTSQTDAPPAAGSAQLNVDLAVQSPAPPAEDLSKVTVHYATNRNRLGVADRTWMAYFQGFFFSLPAVVVYVLIAMRLLIFPWVGKRSWAAAALVIGVAVLCSMAALEAYVRSELRDELSGELYGSIPTNLSYGTCEISVPKPENRSAGELNRPVSVWVFEAPENPDKHFVLRKVNEHADKDAFFESLSAQVGRSEDGASMLFIHGYNVSFEDAIFRTAQLAVDLKYRGAPISFSWPSYADPVKYTFDEQNAEVSIPALREFLEDLVARSGAKRIHIVAHSMGNRVLAGALRSMPPESRIKNREMFREIVLAAPDIDSRVFRTQVLPHLEENTQHCTLYASSRDRALMMSRYFHNYQRLGETEPQLIVANGMDTIDASLVDTSLLGHSYIGDVQSIVSDLHDLVVVGKRPTERGGLQSSLLGELMYWAIKPGTRTASDADTRR